MSQPSQHEFASRLRGWRRARGLTQRELAGDALSVSYVSLLEAGRRTPTPETVRSLAAALGCAPEELWAGAAGEVARPAALTLKFGQLALEAGKVAEAHALFESVLAAAEVEPLVQVEARTGIAQALAAQGRLREAATAYEALVQEAIRSPRYLSSLSVVIRWCRCLYELGELSRVVEVGTGAMRELDRLDAWQSETAIRLLATVAAAHFELGEVTQAERLLREGLRRAEELQSPPARATVLWNASHLASEDGRHREALELAEEALTYFRRSGQQRQVGRLLSQYGLLLLRQEPPRVDEAQQLLEEGLHLLHQVGHGYDRGYLLTELARAHLLKGEPQAASELADRALAELGPEAALERARADTVLAAALAAAGEWERAVTGFDRAAGALRQLGASRQAARAWVELGNLLDQAGDSARAVRAFREAAAAVNLVPTAGSAEPLSSRPG
ncbi:helix-turn-helix transcriptional regulator [Natronosporangium hydrolyticum]|uniref:Helix-turn-helix transcriptional regulator n=1 Tax=Natronosporangium hydrolyticum TaxID=2811111 RepID=A0A895YF73_9ACTN|nr:helix-turn-helix transcriptional regulator [Natronosporangium hydrolyticum]QSB13186.1 helix-turn-helix transcriptional regulator [Natronosporangium hydrolyticum]